MAKTEKIHYILEQVRLCLLREDFARAHILLRKVSPRAFIDVDKKGTNTGEVGIEGSVIEAPEEVLMGGCTTQTQNTHTYNTHTNTQQWLCVLSHAPAYASCCIQHRERLRFSSSRSGIMS